MGKISLEEGKMMNRTLYIKYISTFISILCSSIIFSQNYVINPSFEKVRETPSHPSELGFAFPWSSPNIGTPDLYSSLSRKKEYQIPVNYYGNQDVYNGSLYAAIFTSVGQDKYHGEFIQGELIEKLEQNKLYRIEFYYSLADKSNRYEPTLGACLSEKRLYPTDKFPNKYKYAVKTDNLGELADKENWNKVSGLYVAQGNEQYIIIGKIEQDKLSISTNGEGGYAYYYIDNVLVTLMDSNISNSSLVIDSIEPIKMNQSIVINNIYFESNNSSLKEESNNVLDSLYQQLLQYNNSEYEIEISGHTDNIGKEEDNLILSELRAQAVASYLINKGINREIIKHIGYGSSSPIARNDSEKEREMNRRVELIIRAK